MVKLILVRHSQSEWNKKKLFTGWTNVDLTLLGIKEGKEGAELLKDYEFGIAFTSPMRRALHTFDIIRAANKHSVPVVHSWRLNERHYGDLQGKSKPETMEQFGEAQTLRWRRSWETKPPPLTVEDPRYKEQLKNFPDAEQPLTESLKDCVSRVLPYWYGTIVPELRKGKPVLIVAHGNSIRGIVKVLDHITQDEIPHIEIPVGVPLVYTLDEHNNFWPTDHHYLGDPDEIAKIIERVTNQVKK